MAKRSWNRIIDEPETGNHATINAWIDEKDEFMFVLYIERGFEVECGNEFFERIDELAKDYDGLVYKKYDYDGPVSAKAEVERREAE